MTTTTRPRTSRLLLVFLVVALALLLLGIGDAGGAAGLPGNHAGGVGESHAGDVARLMRGARRGGALAAVRDGVQDQHICRWSR